MSAAERRINAIFEQDSNPLPPWVPRIKEMQKKLTSVGLEPRKIAWEANVMPVCYNIILACRG